MEPALKTRLLGAVVLIALAIIFVPMFFSGSHKNAGDQTVSLKIPDQPDAQLKTATLSVSPEGASATNGSNDPDHVATVDVDAGKPPASPQVQTQPPAVPQNPPTAVAAGVAVAPSRPAPPEAKATAPAKPAPQPAQVAASPVASAPGTAANRSYLLGLGIYADRSNADKLIAKIGKDGYQAQGRSVTYQGKPATHVVAGPFADRASAEAARLKLKGANPGVPITLAANSSDQKADAPANAIPAGKAGGWAVQLGAFGAEADANKLRDRLRALGFDGYVDDIPNGSGKLWRVRAGPVNQRAAAEQLKTQIAAKLKISGIVVTQG